MGVDFPSVISQIVGWGEGTSSRSDPSCFYSSLIHHHSYLTLRSKLFLVKLRVAMLLKKFVRFEEPEGT
jgi:hypothetical protein